MLNVVGNPVGAPKVFNVQDDNKQTVMFLTLAVDRDFKDKNGEYGVDYIQFRAFPRSKAEGSFIWNTITRAQENKRKIAIEASRQQNIYEKNGETMYEEINRVDNINLTGSMNSIQITGRLSRNVQFFSDNVAVVTVAQERGYTPKGASKPDVDHLQVKLFTRSAKQAETFKKHLNKGELVSLSGNIQSSKYTDKNGQVQYAEEIIADHINPFLAKSPNAEASTQAPAEQPAPATNENPFL